MRLTTLLEGVVIGATAMFFLDPVRGKRRRAEFKDKVNREVNRAGEAVRVMQQDFSNRAMGMINQTKHRFSGGDIDDDILVERVRSTLGHHVSHAGALEISASEGVVTLRGDVLANEVEDVIDCIRGIPGLRRVVNEMEVHNQDDGIPSLQGNHRVPLMSSRWTPSTSAVMCMLGLGIAASGLLRRSRVGTLMTLVGTGIVAKGIADTESRFQPIRNADPAKSHAARHHTNGQQGKGRRNAKGDIAPSQSM